MTWEDKIKYCKEDNVTYPVESMMVCDWCGKKIEWHSIHRNYEEPDEETIRISKETHGWVNIGIHQYDGDEKDPCSINVDGVMRHMCPECRKRILGIHSDGQNIRIIKEGD